MKELATVFINYPPGSHGQFLEFVCNLGLNTHANIVNELPFDNDGAAHSKTTEYFSNRVFKRGHFYQQLPRYYTYAKTIEVVLSPSDVLAFWCVRFLRLRGISLITNDAENRNPGFYPDELTDNTYFKLHTNDFDIYLQAINEGFATKIIELYIAFFY